MALKHFLIAPFQSGLQTDKRPWLIPDDAFAQLNNAYIYRGRVRKRFGSDLLEGGTPPTEGYEQLQSRLRMNIGVTPGFLNLPGGVNQLAEGQMFSVGDRIFTVDQLGAGVTTLSTDGAVTCIIDSTVSPNTVIFAGAPAGVTVYYYPSLPVMGLSILEQPQINDEVLIAFDTQFAYQYTASGFERLNAEANAGDSIWTGDNAQFFWTTNYRGADEYENYLYVTNFNESEPNYMRYLAGTVWNTFRPILTASSGPFTATSWMDSARILIPFKGRLVALNTWETDSVNGQNNYPQRARYSQLDSPVEVAVSDTTGAWRDDIPGKGNFIDAATSEAIVTVEYIKDRLIVYFERSTWELVYTQNQAYPFTWQKINTELGAESTFSIIPFDKVAIGVGHVGIHACNGANVERIDNKIPDAVFEIHNDDDGVERVYGIRDYFTEMIYWAFPGVTRNSTNPFNNRVLVFSYETGSWALNEDSITCFGYFQQQNAGNSDIWANLSMTWQENENVWRGAPLQGKFRNVIAGNQEGYVFLVNADQTRNSPALQITNMTGSPATIVAIDHNLMVGDYILIENGQGSTNLNDSIFRVDQVTDKDTIILEAGNNVVGTYTGGGTIARVSRIDIKTKQYNFFINEGVNAYIPKAEFLMDRTVNGEFSVDYFISSSNLGMVNEADVSGALLGTSIVETFPYTGLEMSQSRLWHDVFLSAEGECIQLRLYLSDAQMQNPDISLSDWTMHAINFKAEPTYDI